MTKHIYIDCQSFQTEAWDRGMGRYTMSLLESLYEFSSNDVYTLILSKNLMRNEAAIGLLEKALPNATVVELDLIPTSNEGYEHAAKHNKTILNLYIEKNSKSKNPAFLIPSLFQEPTASVFPDSVQKSLVYYDAIPFLYYQRYQNAIDFTSYMQRFTALYEADIIFTISQTIADDLMIYFGIEDNPTRKVVNIDGACNTDMFNQPTKPKNAPKGEYILLPSSSDIRKNNYTAVKAFEQLRTLTSKDYKLVITSTFNKEQRQQLLNVSSNLLFTGNISQNELAWLYENAKVVFFASEYEGLGLPVLEAVRSNKPMACSNIPVFREISEEAFYFFDPLDIKDITRSLYEAIEGKDWSKKKNLYKAIDAKYQWNRSAELVASNISSFETIDVSSVKKPKIAILGPVPNGYSAIGKVIQELHDTTARTFDIDYFAEDQKREENINVRPNILKYIANYRDVTEFNAKEYAKYDYVLYHIGNSEYHFYTILNALYLPGLVVFHDTSLREAFGEMVRLGYISGQRHAMEELLDTFNKSTKSAFLGSIGNNALAGITHSSYAQKAIAGITKTSGAKIIAAELPVVLPTRNVHTQKRHKVHVGLAGVLTGSKGIDIIKNIALDTDISADIVLHVFGFNFVAPEIVEELSLYKNVKLMTDLSDLDYQTQLANLDILVNFRTSYRGETSLTVLEAMRYGCVAIVNGDLGWFSELPDNAVVKISNQEDVVVAIRSLTNSPAGRKKIAVAAQEYIQSNHSPSEYIKLIHKTLENIQPSVAKKQQLALRESRRAVDVIRVIDNIEEK